MFRTTIREMLVLTVTVALAISWLIARYKLDLLSGQVTRLQILIQETTEYDIIYDDELDRYPLKIIRKTGQ